jgi:nucleoside-diphosphate-sugar epimerase
MSLPQPQSPAPSVSRPVVVTGASGFIGQRLMHVLAEAGFRGFAVSRKAIDALPKNWAHVPRETFLQGGLGEPIAAIIHLEARHHVFQQTAKASDELELVNVGGTRELLRVATRLGCPTFLYFSSIKAVQMGPGVLTESAPGPGTSAYGQTKWMAESLVRDWAAADPSRCARIVRPAVVYGPGNTANVFSMMDAIARGRFPLVGGGGNIKSVVSLENVCAAVVHLLSRIQPGTEVFNLAEPQSFSVRALGDLMADALGVARPTRSIPLPLAWILAKMGDLLMASGLRQFPMNSARLDGLIESSHFSPQKLLTSGFRPVESTEEGIQRLVAWYRIQSRHPGS